MTDQRNKIYWPKDPPQITPEYMAKEFGRTVRSRIWILLEESMRISYYTKSPLKSYNAYDFWEICKDLVSSKKDRFKSINEAIRELEDNGEITRVHGPYEDRFQFSPTGDLRFRFNEGEPKRKDDRYLKLVRELYNCIFDKNITEQDHLNYVSHTDDSLDQDKDYQKTMSHFSDFSLAVAQVAQLFKNPLISNMSRSEKLMKGYLAPYVAISYKPGGWRDKIKKEEIKDKRLLFLH